MKIGNFEITADKYNFILTETYEGKDKDGNPKTQVGEQRYYGTLEDALKAILQENARAEIERDAVTFYNAMHVAAWRIEQALKEQEIPTRKAA